MDVGGCTISMASSGWVVSQSIVAVLRRNCFGNIRVVLNVIMANQMFLLNQDLVQWIARNSCGV